MASLDPSRPLGTSLGSVLPSVLALCLVACVARAPEEVSSTTLASHPCTTALDDCDDGDPCTQDTCDVPNRRCRHIAVANCCAVSDDCEPPLACMTRRCELNVCIYDSIDPCFEPTDAGVDAEATDAGDAAPVDASLDAPDPEPSDTEPVRDASAPAAPLDVRGGACAATPSPSSFPPTALVALAWMLRRRRR